MKYVTYRNTYSKKNQLIFTNVSVLYEDKRYDCVAFWDTGASGSCVSQKIIDMMKIPQCNEVKVYSHQGGTLKPQYKVILILPNEEFIFDVPVVPGDYSHFKDKEVGVVIGMDIIQTGEFNLDCTNGKMIFTFRQPYDGDEDKLIETELF